MAKFAEGDLVALSFGKPARSTVNLAIMSVMYAQVDVKPWWNWKCSATVATTVPVTEFECK